ncbi:hypothetical protein BV898_11808 [Hypsibius exemplaris]|uniref:Uncharacterized protein n=1 Tax=Hypsibius exemplaris TaxID=2072580 RepID=A0A1W0WFS8_HYPEX|nr:hypothetical protein BV898_11808 [Hypsibius exemplaris]
MNMVWILDSFDFDTVNVPRIFGHGMIEQDWIQSTYIPSILEGIIADCKNPQILNDIAQKIYVRYGFSHLTQHDDLRKQIVRLTTDVFYAVPAMKESSMYAKKSTTGLGNQLYVVSSEENFEPGSLLPSPEVMHLFGHVKGDSASQNRSSEQVTRELRRLVGHVVRHGNAFGGQFKSPEARQSVYCWESSRVAHRLCERPTGRTDHFLE